MDNLAYNFVNAFRQKNNGLIQLILINLSVFLLYYIVYVLLWLFKFGDVMSYATDYMALPSSFDRLLFKPWTAFTYFFFHIKPFHFLMNMLFLYWFGSIFADLLGNNRLVHLYLLGGLAGGLAYMLSFNIFPVFTEFVYKSRLLGASGAVYAIVIGAATLAPNYRVYLLFLGPVKIVFIAGFYVLLSFAQIPDVNSGGNIAHLGGALMGFIYVRQLQRGNDWGRPFEWIVNFVIGLYKPRPKLKVAYRNSTSSKAEIGKPTQEEIDRILDKIGERGYESLTKDEREKLFRFSGTTGTK